MAAGVYTGGGATVVMDPAPVIYSKVFRIGGGPDRFTRRNAEKVARTARAIAPVRKGRLKAGIRASQNRDEHGRFSFGYAVESKAYYSRFVHEGTGPSIRVSSPNPMVFAGTNAYAGEVIFTHTVRHPGTPKNPFLEKALVAMVS